MIIKYMYIVCVFVFINYLIFKLYVLEYGSFFCVCCLVNVQFVVVVYL